MTNEIEKSCEKQTLEPNTVFVVYWNSLTDSSNSGYKSLNTEAQVEDFIQDLVDEKNVNKSRIWIVEGFRREFQIEKTTNVKLFSKENNNIKGSN